MSISKKPTAKTISPEDEVQALIKKGGSSADSLGESEKVKNEIVPVSLRLPSGLSDRIEDVITKRPFVIPRHTWLLEAVIEKLEREEGA